MATKLKSSIGVEGLGLPQGLPVRERLGFLLLLLLLFSLVVGSALAVIYSSYKSRQLFAELQTLGRDTLHLEEEWGRLLIEQSTWASHSHVENVARAQLNMIVPSADDIVVVEQ